MNLTLEIVSPNGQSLGAARRTVFGFAGGRIGRAPDCDWVLPSPYVSRHHATVRCIRGTYYIESTGENGVAVNNPQATLPPLERRELKNGDRLFISEYEIAVWLGYMTAETAQDALFDPLGGAAPPPAPSSSEAIPNEWIPLGRKMPPAPRLVRALPPSPPVEEEQQAEGSPKPQLLLGGAAPSNDCKRASSRDA